MGAPELLIVAFVFGVIVLPIVLVVWVAKASKRYRRNVALAELLASKHDVRPVGVGWRLLAFAIDMVVFGVVVGTIGMGIEAGLGDESEAAGAILVIVGWFAYFAGMEVIWGATLGKMVLRLRVIRADLGNPGLGAALVRNFCKIYGAFSLVGIVITIVCMTGSPAAQRFGDRLVGTTVVRRPKLGLEPSWPSVPPPVRGPSASPDPSTAAGLEIAAPEAIAVTAATLAQEQAAGATVSEPLAEGAASVGLASYCGGCGNEFDFDDDRFCPRCGQIRSAEA